MDEADSVNNEEHQYNDKNINAIYEGIDEICFSYSEFTGEEDLAYYNDNWLNLEQIEEITNAKSSPHALYKTTNKLTKSQIILTGAGGSKLAFLGFAYITCWIRSSPLQKNLQ